MENELVQSNVPHTPLHIAGSPVYHENASESPLHYHDEVELLICLGGTKLIWVDEKEYILRPGEVAFINARIPHRTVDPPPFTHVYLLQFRPEAYSTGDDNSRPLRHLSRFLNLSGDHPIHIFPAGHSLYDTLIRLIDEKERALPFYETFLRGEIYCVLGELYRSGMLCDTEHVLGTAAIQKVMPALLYTDEHYDEDLSLSSVANLCQMSEGYFCRQFKAATGSTFIEYLNFVRIHQAEKLLTRTARPVLDISMEVGFANVSYFNRIFRRFKSCSPNSYRHAQHLREK